MKQVRETLIKEDMKATIRVSIFLTVLLVILESILCFFYNGFLIFLWIPILPLIHIWKKKAFFKKALVCYGKVVDVTLSMDSDVNLYTKIEFMDNNLKEIHETVLEEHWGDFIEEEKEEIQVFYNERVKRIGKKVPVFYLKDKPYKNLIFINHLED